MNLPRPPTGRSSTPSRVRSGGDAAECATASVLQIRPNSALMPGTWRSGTRSSLRLEAAAGACLVFLEGKRHRAGTPSTSPIRGRSMAWHASVKSRHCRRSPGQRRVRDAMGLPLIDRQRPARDSIYGRGRCGCDGARSNPPRFRRPGTRKFRLPASRRRGRDPRDGGLEEGADSIRRQSTTMEAQARVPDLRRKAALRQKDAGDHRATLRTQGRHSTSKPKMRHIRGGVLRTKRRRQAPVSLPESRADIA